MARLGGDEFVVLAPNASLDERDNIIARLKENLRAVNKQDRQGYRLSLSMGAVLIEHDSNLSVDQLIGKADKAMYDHKRSKKLLPNAIVRSEAHEVPHSQVRNTLANSLAETNRPLPRIAY